MQWEGRMSEGRMSDGREGWMTLVCDVSIGGIMLFYLSIVCVSVYYVPVCIDQRRYHAEVHAHLPQAVYCHQQPPLVMITMVMAEVMVKSSTEGGLSKPGCLCLCLCR